MARNNVIFGNDRAFQSNGNYAPAPQYSQQYGYSNQPAPGEKPQMFNAPSQTGPISRQAEQQNFEAMYHSPAASSFDTGRLTWRDALNAITATLGLIIVIAAGVMTLPWMLGTLLGSQGEAIGMLLVTAAAVVGGIGALITVLVAGFGKKAGRTATLVYAVFEGLLVGAISIIFEMNYSGIVMQAVLGTLAVAGAVILLFRSGKVRTSPRLNKIFFVALIAYMLFSIVNLVMVLMGGGSLRTGLLGLAIGAIAVLMASYSLVMDMEQIQNAVDNQAPRNYAWVGALGVAVTIVWMYIEILRIIAILRGND